MVSESSVIRGSKFSYQLFGCQLGFRLGREVIWRHDANHRLATDTPNPSLPGNGRAPVPRFAQVLSGISSKRRPGENVGENETEMRETRARATQCWRILPSNLSVRSARALCPLVRCGEYSLAIYCVGVLLSFAAHAILAMGWNNLTMQTLLSIAGIGLMAAVATMLGRINRAAEAHPRPF
jgi:hypothetical protein